MEKDKVLWEKKFKKWSIKVSKTTWKEKISFVISVLIIVGIIMYFVMR